MANCDFGAADMREKLLEGWRLRTLIISVLVTVVGYLAFSIWSGWHDVLRAFALVGPSGLAAALGMSMLNYWLRFVRWQMYLNALGHSVPWQPSGRIYLAGFALTTTPGKAGEAMRGVLLKPWSVPYPHSFAALLSERLSDLTAVVLFTLFGLSVYPQAHAVIVLGMIAVLSGLVVLSQATLLQRLYASTSGTTRRVIRLLHHLAHMLIEARRCHSARVLLPATILSVLAWGAEAAAFHWILQWLGADISLAFAVFVYALAMLAGALSFLPGGLGGAEAVMAGLLVWKGMSTAEAVAATVLIRLATLWFAVMLGLVSLIISGNGRNRKVIA